MSEDGSMRTGACILEHADRRVTTKRCDQKGEEHEYGSMQTGSIHFQQKIMRFDFFQSTLNCEQGNNYLFNHLLTNNILV